MSPVLGIHHPTRLCASLFLVHHPPNLLPPFTSLCNIRQKYPTVPQLIHFLLVYCCCLPNSIPAFRLRLCINPSLLITFTRVAATLIITLKILPPPPSNPYSRTPQMTHRFRCDYCETSPWGLQEHQLPRNLKQSSGYVPRSYYNYRRSAGRRRQPVLIANWNDDYGRGDAGDGGGGGERSGWMGRERKETESEEEKVKWYCGRWKEVRVWKLGRGAKRKEGTLVM